MANYNHNLPFRPLRGGIAIINPAVNEPGTLGCLLTSNGADRWILSCYHVLGRIDGTPFPDGESIFQPGQTLTAIARNSSGRSNWSLDCSAAELSPGIDSVSDILGLTQINACEAPQIGMRVIKSGAETGVTEGVVTNVNGDTLEIGVPPTFDPNYELSAPGDSGSVWVDKETRNIVALHRGGSSFGPHTAYATSILPILGFLGMDVIT